MCHCQSPVPLGAAAPTPSLPVTCLEALQIRTNHGRRQALAHTALQSLLIRPCILATKSSLAEELIHLPSASATPFEWEMRGSHLLLPQPRSGEEEGPASSPCPLGIAPQDLQGPEGGGGGGGVCVRDGAERSPGEGHRAPQLVSTCPVLGTE